MPAFRDPQIDRDHALILDRFSETYGTLSAEESQREARLRLAEALETHLREHFAREERVMADADYPDRAAHIRAHAALERRTRRLLADLEPPGCAGNLARLRELFLGHILTWDASFEAWAEAPSGPGSRPRP